MEKYIVGRQPIKLWRNDYLNNILSKEEFAKTIEDVRVSNDYQKGLNKYFKSHDVDGCIYQPDCSCAVLRLLHTIFGEADSDEWISMFCFDYDFGRKYKDQIKDKSGTIIPFSTINDLYAVLTEKTE